MNHPPEIIADPVRCDPLSTVESTICHIKKILASLDSKASENLNRKGRRAAAAKRRKK